MTRRRRLVELGEVIPLRLRTVLEEPGGAVDRIVFPLSGMASMVADTEKGMSVEAASIGREGLVGVAAFMAAPRASLTVLVQIEGEALSVPRDMLCVGLRTGPLADLGRRYAQSLMAQLGQAAACNRVHEVEERAARWLLGVADRLDTPVFELTHEFLGIMLGTHRPTVSLAVGMLRSGGPPPLQLVAR